MAPENLFQLPAGTKERLKGMDKEAKDAKRMLGILEKLGMDVSPIREKLDWAEEVRKVMLSEFTD